MANRSAKTSHGHVVYLDNDRDHIFDLHHNIRFIETTDFPVSGYKEFYGFICGILSQDHDIDYVYIDGLLKLSRLSLEEAQSFIERLKEISEKYNVKFIIGMNCKEKEIPENLRSFLIA